MRLRAAGFALALALAPLASAHSAEPGSETFAERSLKAGRIQASLARLAAERAENSDVRRFAAALQHDLDARNARLVAIVRAAGVREATVDSRGYSTDELPQRTREFHRLRARDGGAFDRQFLRAVIVYYENAIRGYQAETDSGNEEVRDLAGDSLPRLRQDLAAARRLLADLEERRR